MTVLLQTYYSVCHWKNFENQSKCDKIMGKIVVAPFMTHSVSHKINTKKTKARFGDLADIQPGKVSIYSHSPATSHLDV